MLTQDLDRRILPRWRSAAETIASGELAPRNAHVGPAPLGERFFDEKLRDWQDTPGLGIAADLVAAAVVLHRTAEASDAAKFVLDNEARLPRPLRRAARLVLGLDKGGPLDPNVGPTEMFGEPSARIRRLRKKVRRYPRNALAWVDLSLAYASVGLGGQAEDAMRVGLGVAPENRFTLRSAARLFVNQGDAERAHHLLSRARLAKSDSWLMAAEIAVASVLGRDSRLIKPGRRLIQSGDFSPRDSAELASALATVHLVGGDVRQARRLFNQALVDPNDNAVAQARWASGLVSAIHIEPHHLELPTSYEARAWDAFLRREWRESRVEAGDWLADEPFSSRPAVLASFLYAIPEDDYENSVRVARAGLDVSPNDSALLNNLTFALASSGLPREARDVFGQIDEPQAGSRARIAWLATNGLVLFREGNPVGGRARYQEAIDLARSLADVRREAMARIFLAREAIECAENDGEELLRAAMESSRSVDDAGVHASLTNALRTAVRRRIPI